MGTSCPDGLAPMALGLTSKLMDRIVSTEPHVEPPATARLVSLWTPCWRYCQPRNLAPSHPPAPASGARQNDRSGPASGCLDSGRRHRVSDFGRRHVGQALAFQRLEPLCLTEIWRRDSTKTRYDKDQGIVPASETAAEW